MKFAMFSDLHYDAIPDGDARVEEIITYAKKSKVDFIVDMVIYVIQQIGIK